MAIQWIIHQESTQNSVGPSSVCTALGPTMATSPITYLTYLHSGKKITEQKKYPATSNGLMLLGLYHKLKHM